jgi:pimeloyl-ACP methyl ester carboxylesterase
MALTDDAPTLPFRAGRVAIRSAGEGPPVGYLHGMIGNPGVHPFLEALAASGRRAVAPSLPGFTGSSPCEDLRSLHDWVVATSEVIDVTGLAGRPLVASSVGAMLALEVAAVRPEVASALVLVAPFGLWDDDDPVADPFGTTLSVQRQMLTADPAVTSSFFDDHETTPADVLVEVGVDRYHTRTAAAALIWPIPEHGISTRLHRVSCPVTLIWGAEDAIIPPSYLGRWAAALPNVAGTHVVEGAGHHAEWDRPAEVAEIALRALA